MPLALSGVMLPEYTVPNGVSIARPPAEGPPPIAVWQAMQSAAATRYAPRPLGADDPLARARFATLPQSSGSLPASLAGFIRAGTGCAASQAVSVGTSSAAKRPATSAMQSGAIERSRPLRQAPNCAFMYCRGRPSSEG